MTSGGNRDTMSGRVSQAPKVLTYQQLGQAMTESGAFTTEDISYYEALNIGSTFGLEELELEETQIGYQAGELVASTLSEVARVGAAVGGGFNNTAELKPMKYKEAMKCSYKDLWDKAVKEEHRKFVKCKVFKAIKHEDVNEDNTSSNFKFFEDNYGPGNLFPGGPS